MRRESVCVVLTVGVGDEDDLLGVDLVHELDLVLEQRVVAVTLLRHINQRKCHKAGGAPSDVVDTHRLPSLLYEKTKRVRVATSRSLRFSRQSKLMSARLL